MIKHCTLLDHTGWLPLRVALWPDCAPDNEPDKQTLLNAPERYQVLISDALLDNQASHTMHEALGSYKSQSKS